MNAREDDAIYYLLPDSIQWAVDLTKEKGPPFGSLHFRCQTMGLLCTNRLCTVPWPCDMAGPHLNYHTNANVGVECQWSTLSHVQKEASP